MIEAVQITNYLGEKVRIVLSEEEPKHGFYIQSMTGLGPAKANINTINLAVVDGSLFNMARLNQRNIVMRLLFGFAGNIEDTRQRTYKFLPIKKPLELLIETDNRRLVTTGYVESNEPEIFSNAEVTQISIICPDPYFYSDSDSETLFYGVEPLFEFPFSNESLTEPLLEFGEIKLLKEKTIVYDGEAEVGILITIHALGEASNIVIYNVNTRESMHIDTDMIETLTGSGIVAGDDIIISTVRGNKYVRLLREGSYINILNCIERGSDWFTLVKGDNVFAYEAEYGEDNLQIKIQNRVLYEGV